MNGINRKIIISIRFHSEDKNTYSSNDFRKCTIENDIKIPRDYINFIKKYYGLSLYWVGYHSSSEIFIVHISYQYVNSTLAKTICSYIADDNQELSSEDIEKYAEFLIKEFYNKEREDYIQLRKEKGYVTTYNSHPNPLIDLWGKLNKQIIIDNLEYLATGNVFGYFGSTNRMIKHDEWINEIYESNKKVSDFLNYSNARHFMDGITEDTTKEEFVIKCLKSLEYI